MAADQLHLGHGQPCPANGRVLSTSTQAAWLMRCYSHALIGSCQSPLMSA